jgi:iron complex outermembrane receptor protein
MTSNEKRQLEILCAIFAVLVTVLMSQSLVWADDLTGRVLDPQGSVVADAQLKLYDRKSGELRTTVSNSEGGYSFRGIPSGDYLLEADASSAALTASRQISVRGDQSADVELKISATNVEVLVTAVGAAQSIEEVAKAIDVVDSDQIAQRDELSITEAIRNLPGIRVKQLEGPGSLVSIKTRGLRNSDTAVLIDGMRFRDAASLQGDATAFLEDMTIVDTERIEFLRGSGSSLYGSHALGGVVNVSSRPGGGATHGEFRAEGGGLGMIRSVLGIGGGLAADRFTYSGSVSHLNVTKGARDGSPYRNTATQGALKYSFTPGISVGGRLWYSNSYLAATESPTYSPATIANGRGPIYTAVALPIDQLERFERKQPYSAGNATYIPNQIDPDGRRLGTFVSGAVNFQHHVSSATSYHVGYQRVYTNRTYLDGPAGPGSFEPSGPSRSNFKGYVDTVQAHLDQRVGNYNLVSAGYEFEAEKYYTFNGTDAGTNYVDLRQRSNALYIQDQIRLVDGQLQITVAERAQSFSLQAPKSAGSTPYAGVSAIEPPTAYTGDGSIAYFFRKSGTKLRSHIGNSFRSPAGYERYGGGPTVYYGDPRLSPERAIALDGGIDQWLFGSKLQLGGTMYYTKLQEMIRFESLPAGDPFGRIFGGYRNGGGGIARGFELSGKVSPTASTNIQTSYTYTNSESRTPTIASINYYDVLGVSKHAFTLTATQWFAKRFNVAFDMSAVSDYTTTLFGLDFSSRPFTFNGPTKADIVFHYDHPLTDRRSLEFYTKVENVLNQQPYEDGFIGPKAWAIAGLRFKY